MSLLDFSTVTEEIKCKTCGWDGGKELELKHQQEMHDLQVQIQNLNHAGVRDLMSEIDSKRLIVRLATLFLLLCISIGLMGNLCEVTSHSNNQLEFQEKQNQRLYEIKLKELAIKEEAIKYNKLNIWEETTSLE